jgi:hypothetical protein
VCEHARRDNPIDERFLRAACDLAGLAGSARFRFRAFARIRESADHDVSRSDHLEWIHPAKIYRPIQGFGKEPKDYDVRVESRRTDAGFRVTSDTAPASIGFWSIRSVISVEPFVDLGTDPGKTTTWRYVYTYYVNSK